jgi:hypothetical protein
VLYTLPASPWPPCSRRSPPVSPSDRRDPRRAGRRTRVWIVDTPTLANRQSCDDKRGPARLSRRPPVFRDQDSFRACGRQTLY